MYDIENMSPSDHEEVSIRFLVKFRDVYEERMAKGEVSPSEKTEGKVEMLEGLLFSYFDIRRNIVPIPFLDPSASCQELIDFINDEVLLFMSEEHPELLIYDRSSGRYDILFEDNED